MQQAYAQIFRNISNLTVSNALVLQFHFFYYPCFLPSQHQYILQDENLSPQHNINQNLNCHKHIECFTSPQPSGILFVQLILRQTLTLKAISGRLAIKYNRLPIMLLYKLWSTSLPQSSLQIFRDVAIEVDCLVFSRPNFLPDFVHTWPVK